MRHLVALLTLVFLAVPGLAQEQSPPDPAETERQSTGGAQTLEDILARQRGEAVDSGFRQVFGDPNSAAGIAEQLGTLGGASDPDLWRALRYGQG